MQSKAHLLMAKCTSNKKVLYQGIKKLGPEQTDIQATCRMYARGHTTLFV